MLTTLDGLPIIYNTINDFNISTTHYVTLYLQFNPDKTDSGFDS